jgi:DnaK suppressor protein
MKTNEQAGLELQLIEMRKRLLRDVDSAQEAMIEDVVKSGQISTLPTQAGDADIEGFDAQVAISLNEESLLEQVEASIKRLEAGTYGVCQQCGHKIGMERLKAIPYAAHCIKCAQIEPVQTKKPVTGEPRHRW